jgi:pimeloyl-ACP methyl ester carboxylesterase
MLAWLQRCWVVCLSVIAIAIAWALTLTDMPWWAIAAVTLAVLNVHALGLAIEFGWLRTVAPGSGVPKPTARVLASAWWGEVLTGLRVFGWRQPFRSAVFDDAVSDQPGRRGVLLVHGFVCNRGLWNPWMRQLRGHGTPYIAVNLEPVFGSIDHYVQTIETAVARLERATRCAPIVVAHSMGGLAVRAWLRQYASEQRVHSVVTIGTPHAGTWLARFAMVPNARQMREGSRWLQELQVNESSARRALFTCYFGHCDNIVFPARNATLPDASNHHVPGVAHVHLAFHPPILDDVLKRLAS